MSQSNNQLANLVRDISYFYIKHYYNDLLEKKKVKKISNEELRVFINTMYSDKQLDLKKYIRETLKENLGAGYNSLVVENIILEMFNDPEYSKYRVYLEIIEYQNKI